MAGVLTRPQRRALGPWPVAEAMQSSEARGRADSEYQQVIEWLDSSLRWSRDGAVATAEVNDTFGRVERAELV